MRNSLIDFVYHDPVPSTLRHFTHTRNFVAYQPATSSMITRNRLATSINEAHDFRSSHMDWWILSNNPFVGGRAGAGREGGKGHKGIWLSSPRLQMPSQPNNAHSNKFSSRLTRTPRLLARQTGCLSGTFITPSAALSGLPSIYIGTHILPMDTRSQNAATKKQLR